MVATIQQSLATCRAHLDNIPDSDLTKTEVESRLVAGLVLLIVSEYEVLIGQLFKQRVAQCGDPHVCNYFGKSIARRFWPRLATISEVLGMFGEDYRHQFLSTIQHTPEHAAWDNIVAERHAVAHKSGPRQMTLGDLISAFPDSWGVIAALKQALGLP